MSEYLHGAYGKIQAVGARVADESLSAMVYVGTAPVHTLALASGDSYPVNKPIVVNNIAEARKYLGYSDDWDKYTLCEAMHVHLEEKGVGPLVLINVLDPTKAAHKSANKTTTTKTPVSGKITIPSAESVILESVAIKTIVEEGETAVTKVKGTDYTISYNMDKKLITITEVGSGLGTDALTVEYDTIDATGVTASDVIGTTDDLGTNTGLYVMRNVYQATGYIPAYLLCPGFSGLPTVHAAMKANSVKLNGHWDTYMFVDLPISSGGTALTLATAATWKAANGYTAENETVFFPLAKGLDGKVYHLSVLAAANFQELLIENDGIPYKTASNTECSLIEKLYLGANGPEVVGIDDQIINKYLNKYGIASAAYAGGRWAIWGCHSADYTFEDGDQINVAETNRMMLYYISNDFQHRRTEDVDKPTTANDLRTIVAEEQTRIDALLNINALTYGVVSLNAQADDRSDIMNGDFSFMFNITTTPLAKSLTAIVNWTDDGFVTYFETLTE